MRRYWPGKRPVWAKSDSDVPAVDDNEEDEEHKGGRDLLSTTRKRKFVLQDKEDARLRRLAENKLEADARDDIIRSLHRRIHKAEILSTTPEHNNQCLELEDEEEVEDEDVLEEKRRKLREKVLLHRQQDEDNPSLLSQEEEDDESEYETTDSECEEPFPRGGTMLEKKKPVYVPKSDWDTSERERDEARKCALHFMLKKRAEERKSETMRILLSLIKEEEERFHNNVSSDTIIVDDDFNGKEEEKAEYEAWKIREISRMRRDKVVADRDKEEIIREHLAEEKPRSRNPPSKQKLRFMQKYYHRGAFFQSNRDDLSAPADNIYARDFSAPTGEDKMDKTLLPKIMQVKNFGRLGRTKWTHLRNEDTTRPRGRAFQIGTSTYSIMKYI